MLRRSPLLLLVAAIALTLAENADAATRELKGGKRNGERKEAAPPAALSADRRARRRGECSPASTLATRAAAAAAGWSPCTESRLGSSVCPRHRVPLSPSR